MKVKWGLVLFITSSPGPSIAYTFRKLHMSLMIEHHHSHKITAKWGSRGWVSSNMKLRPIRWLMIFRAGWKSSSTKHFSMKCNMIAMNVFQWCILIKLAIDDQPTYRQVTLKHMKFSKNENKQQYHLDMDCLAAWNKSDFYSSIYRGKPFTLYCGLYVYAILSW